MKQIENRVKVSFIYGKLKSYSYNQFIAEILPCEEIPSCVSQQRQQKEYEGEPECQGYVCFLYISRKKKEKKSLCLWEDDWNVIRSVYTRKKKRKK